MSDEDKHLAARLANGEPLASVLRYVRKHAWSYGFDVGHATTCDGEPRAEGGGPLDVPRINPYDD